MQVKENQIKYGKMVPSSGKNGDMFLISNPIGDDKLYSFLDGEWLRNSDAKIREVYLDYPKSGIATVEYDI